MKPILVLYDTGNVQAIAGMSREDLTMAAAMVLKFAAKDGVQFQDVLSAVRCIRLVDRGTVPPPMVITGGAG